MEGGGFGIPVARSCACWCPLQSGVTGPSPPVATKPPHCHGTATCHSNCAQCVECWVCLGLLSGALCGGIHCRVWCLVKTASSDTIMVHYCPAALRVLPPCVCATGVLRDGQQCPRGDAPGLLRLPLAGWCLCQWPRQPAVRAQPQPQPAGDALLQCGIVWRAAAAQASTHIQVRAGRVRARSGLAARGKSLVFTWSSRNAAEYSSSVESIFE